MWFSISSLASGFCTIFRKTSWEYAVGGVRKDMKDNIATYKKNTCRALSIYVSHVLLQFGHFGGLTYKVKSLIYIFGIF